MKSKHKKDKISALRTQVEAGLHPMQAADHKSRQRSAEPIAEKMIEQALCAPQKNP